MIDDIVELPRPYQAFRRGATLASYRAFEPPTSAFGLATGYASEVQDLPICEGNEFELLVGKNTPFRYKFIEHQDKTITEYVAIADGPLSSRDTHVFTLWTNVVDKETLKVKKFYSWNTILEARNYFSMQECTMLSHSTHDAVKLTGTLDGMPGLQRAYQWAHKNLEPISEEEKELDRLRMINANRISMEDAYDCGFEFFSPFDIFRGASKEVPPYKLVTCSGRILSRHSIQAPEVKKLLGPDFATRPYQQCLRPTKGVKPNTTIDALTEFSGWFDVLKYIELIPYSEVYLQFAGKQFDVMRVYDPYDGCRHFDIDVTKHAVGGIEDDLLDTVGLKHSDGDEELKLACKQAVYLLERIRDLTSDLKSFSVYRSWGEEVYITITNQDRTTRRYYFDLVHAAIGSRMFEPKDV